MSVIIPKERLLEQYVLSHFYIQYCKSNVNGEAVNTFQLSFVIVRMIKNIQLLRLVNLPDTLL